MNKQPIIIVGQPRTGSSSVAKILQEIDVFIGYEFEKLEHNPDGTFEDVEFTTRSKKVISNIINIEEYKKEFDILVKKRQSLNQKWGWKDPRSYKLLDFYLEYFENPKFIRCHRPIHRCMESMVKSFGYSMAKAYKTYNAINYILDEKLENRRVLDISIQDLIDNKAKDKIINFNKYYG